MEPRKISNKEIFQLIPQLRTFRMCGYDVSLMKSKEQYIQSVEVFDIECHAEFYASDHTVIHPNNVRKFHINLKRFNLVRRIPFSSTRFENLELTFDEFDYNFGDFIKANPSLRMLTALTYWIVHNFENKTAELCSILFDFSKVIHIALHEI